LNDAGAAARICAVLTENKRPCETTIFEGQRLALKPDDPPPTAARPVPHRRGIAKRGAAGRRGNIEEAGSAATGTADDILVLLQQEKFTISFGHQSITASS